MRSKRPRPEPPQREARMRTPQDAKEETPSVVVILRRDPGRSGPAPAADHSNHMFVAKWRFANARPEPDFKYRSKRSACCSL